jgi:hypothetical protein
MFKVMKLLIYAILLIISFNVNAGDHVTLEDLDAILKKAGSLEVFLENKSLQQEYYNLACEYYGHNFALEERERSYWVILDQMRVAIKENPTLAKRLWSTSDLGGAFQLDAKIKDSGLILDGKKYSDAWGELAAREEEKISNIDMPREELLRTEAQETADWINRQKNKIESDYRDSTLSTEEKKRQRGKAYQHLQSEVANQESFQKLKSALVVELSKKETFGDVLRSGDSNIVLGFLEKLKNNSSEVFAIKGMDAATIKILHPYVVGNLPKELIDPKIPKLTVTNGKPAETEFFKVKTKEVKIRDATGKVISTKIIPQGTTSGSLELKPIPRRFHGVFRGVELGECVAGGSCKTISIERWAAPALDGSHHYYVETANRYQGFVSLFPGEIDGARVSNIEFGANILNQNIEYNGKPYPLYEHVMKKLSQNMPSKTSGFLVGDSLAISNSGVLQNVQSSLPYLSGEAKSVDFKHKDHGVLDSIIKERERQGTTGGYAARYEGKGIIDANMSKEANIILNESYILSDKPVNENDFRRILSQADRGMTNAITYIGKNENINRRGVIEVLVNQARKDNGLAITTLASPTNITRRGIFELIKSQAENGSSAAIKALSYPSNITRPGIFELIKSQARDGNSAALEALGEPSNISRAGVLDILIEQASASNSTAWNKLADNLDHPRVLKFMKNSASEGNIDATRRLMSPGNVNRPGILDFIKKLALNGDRHSLYELGSPNNIELPGVLDLLKQQAKRENVHAIGRLADSRNLNRFEILNFLIEEAKSGNKTVITNLEHRIERPEILNLFKTLAREGKLGTIYLSSTYIDHPGGLDILKDAAARGNTSALNALLKPENIDRPGIMDIVTGLAKKDDSTAIRFLLKPENIGRPGVMEVIKDLALRNNYSAVSFLLKPENIDRAGVLDIIKDLAKKDNSSAIRYLLKPENINRPGVAELLSSKLENGTRFLKTDVARIRDLETHRAASNSARDCMKRSLELLIQATP